MFTRNTHMTMTALLLGAGAAYGAGNYPDAIASHNELFMSDIASRMFQQLPADQQDAIARAGGIGSDAHPMHTEHDCSSDDVLDCNAHDAPPLPDVDPGITARDYMGLVISDELDARLTQEQRNILNTIANALDDGKTVPHLCFSPDTDREYAYAVNQLIEFPFQVRFQQTGRWTSTATNGGGLGQGTPTTLTYSFVPDGTFIPNLNIGLGSGNSALFQWLDNVYGNTQTWQDLFHQVFDRWEELIGVTYVWEPNDDGSNTNTGAGILGVRGDVRIGAFDFQNDGNGGVLAYNNFPNDGDMIFDAFDTFYSSNTSGNSRRLRNVIAHEHGHGLGMLHVCPANQTKLMEPFVSTAYDGPQLDDILNGIRHYGDNNEPDNSIAQATDLGDFSVGGAASVSNVGVDDNTDDDYYRIGLNEPARIFFSVGPDAATYDQGPQTSQCNTGANTNYNSIQNLRVTVQNSSGDTLLVTNDTGLGGIESVLFDAETAGEYFFIVDGATNVNNVQRYQLSVFIQDLPFLGPIISADAPDSVDPGTATPFSVTIDPREDTILPGTALLFTSTDGVSYTSTPLASNGGTSYTATIPAVSCDDTLSFYISAEGDIDGVITLPEGGASAPYTALVGELTVAFEDNFQNNLGWTVTGPVSGQGSGVWQRGVPQGDGSRGDAPNDADGSGACYLTGNGGPGSNTDVDGGQTILNSPLLDLSSSPEAVVSYSRWYDNTGSGTGAAPGADVFTVQVSNDLGTNWTTVEVVGPSDAQSSGGWFDASFRVADFVTPNNLVVVRFIAEDIGDGSVIEAAVDAFRVESLDCEDPANCPADLNGDGNLDFFDVSAFLTNYNNMDADADFNGDGNFDFFDVSAFLSAYNAGCP